MRVALTHKGWFGLCPVYTSSMADPAPLVWERHIVFLPLMWFSEVMFDLCFWLMLNVQGVEPQGWPITITGDLVPPKWVDWEERK